MMEFQPIKRTRTSHIDEAGIIYPVPPHTEEDEQKEAVDKMVNALQKSNEHTAIEEHTDENKLPVIQNFTKALSEMNQVLNLVSMIRQNEYFTVQKVARNVMPYKEQPLPPSQKISLYKSMYMSAGTIISKGLSKSAEVGNIRRQFLIDCLRLRKRWRLMLSPYHNTKASLLNRVITARDGVLIDCSVVSTGDNQNEESSVPLRISSSVNDPGVQLAMGNITKTLYTLQFQLIIKGESHHQHPILSCTSYDLHNLAAVTTDNCLDMSPSAKSVHTYCIRRLHDNFCRRLFQYIRAEAVSVSTSATHRRGVWVVGSEEFLPNDGIHHSKEFAGIPFDLLSDDRVDLDVASLSTLRVLLVERGRILIQLLDAPLSKDSRESHMTTEGTEAGVGLGSSEDPVLLAIQLLPQPPETYEINESDKSELKQASEVKDEETSCGGRKGQEPLRRTLLKYLSSCLLFMEHNYLRQLGPRGAEERQKSFNNCAIDLSLFRPVGRGYIESQPPKPSAGGRDGVVLRRTVAMLYHAIYRRRLETLLSRCANHARALAVAQSQADLFQVEYFSRSSMLWSTQTTASIKIGPGRRLVLKMNMDSTRLDGLLDVEDLRYPGQRCACVSCIVQGYSPQPDRPVLPSRVCTRTTCAPEDEEGSGGDMSVKVHQLYRPVTGPYSSLTQFRASLYSIVAFEALRSPLHISSLLNTVLIILYLATGRTIVAKLVRALSDQGLDLWPGLELSQTGPSSLLMYFHSCALLAFEIHGVQPIMVELKSNEENGGLQGEGDLEDGKRWHFDPYLRIVLLSDSETLTESLRSSRKKGLFVLEDETVSKNTCFRLSLLGQNTDAVMMLLCKSLSEFLFDNFQ